MMLQYFQQWPLEIGSAWAKRMGLGEVGMCTSRVWETALLPYRALISGNEAFFSCVDERFTTESHDWVGGVWSQTCRGWLQGHSLVWSLANRYPKF